MKVRYFGHQYPCKIIAVRRKRIVVKFETRRSGPHIRAVDPERLTISQADRERILATTSAPFLVPPDDMIRFIELLREAGRWPEPMAEAVLDWLR